MSDKMSFENLLNSRYSEATVAGIKLLLKEQYDPQRVWKTVKAMDNFIAGVIRPMFSTFVRENKLEINHPDIRMCRVGLSAKANHGSREPIIPFAIQLILGERDITKYQKRKKEKKTELEYNDPDYWEKRKFLQQLRVEAKRVEKTFKNI